jgi:terminase, large subunit
VGVAPGEEHGLVRILCRHSGCRTRHPEGGDASATRSESVGICCADDHDVSLAVAAVLDRRIWAHLKPPRRLQLSRWADEHFLLPIGDPNAGRWRCLPYQRGILDAISDPGIERVSVMKSSRVGYTKCFCAATIYFIVEDPGPILIVQPTIDDAKKHSKEDLAPILRDVAVVRGLVAEPKSRISDNTIMDKSFRGGSLSLIGANSPRGFRRTSRRIVIFDEVDGYPKSAGTEGDPYKLGERRTATFWNRKIIAGSTPTEAGSSRIDDLFQEGDQRRFYVPCPTCHTFQVLKFEQLRFPDGPSSAHFICTANGCRIEERQKHAIVEAGEWRAEAPEHFTPLNRHASFHIWTAYSYAPNASWQQIADEFLRAKGSPITLKTFRNTVQGEVWKEAVVTRDWEALARRREPYTIGTVPTGVLFLTAGVDVQKDRLVYEVVGWGRGRTSWSIEAGVVMGDTAQVAGPWSKLDQLLMRSFTHEAQPGLTFSIRRLAVDSGFNTQHVYSWARRYPFTRVIPIKGQDGVSGMLLGTPKIVEYTGGGRKLKRGYKHWPVFTHVAKDELYGFLGLERPIDSDGIPPGYCHFPEYDQEFFKQLTAEHLIPSKFGRYHVYRVIEGRENHALDARIYARAAAAAEGLDRLTELDWQHLEQAVAVSDVKPQTISAPAQRITEDVASTTPPPRPRTTGPWLQRPRTDRDRWLGRTFHILDGGLSHGTIERIHRGRMSAVGGHCREDSDRLEIQSRPETVDAMDHDVSVRLLPALGDLAPGTSVRQWESAVVPGPVTDTEPECA